MQRLICFLLALLSVFAFAGCGAAEKPQTEEVVSYDETQFYAAGEENNIYCKLYIPRAEGRFPAVILSHSAKMTAESMNSYAKEFASRGFVACSFDFCGGSSQSRSGGSESDMTIFTEKEDLKAVISAVRAREEVNGDRIYLFGTSQGGFVSALVANDCPEEIAALIMLYPAFNIPELAQNASGSDNDRKYIDTLQGFVSYENIGAYKGNVLILHGSNDVIVNKSYSERAAEVYENCKLVIIQGATHGFNGENLTAGGFDLSSIFGNYDAEVWKEIDSFLNETEE